MGNTSVYSHAINIIYTFPFQIHTKRFFLTYSIHPDTVSCTDSVSDICDVKGSFQMRVYASYAVSSWNLTVGQ